MRSMVAPRFWSARTLEGGIFDSDLLNHRVASRPENGDESPYSKAGRRIRGRRPADR